MTVEELRQALAQAPAGAIVWLSRDGEITDMIGAVEQDRFVIRGDPRDVVILR